VIQQIQLLSRIVAAESEEVESAAPLDKLKRIEHKITS
jgi:hypothetical protein